MGDETRADFERHRRAQLGIPGANQPYRFNGPEYDPKHDQARLTGQALRTFDCMRDGKWRTLNEIADLTNDPAASISAQLRHLRKPRFGSHTVERRARGDRSSGLFEYRLVINDKRIA
jgi:hypothetical protein